MKKRIDQQFIVPQGYPICLQRYDGDIGIMHKKSGAVWKSMTYDAYLLRTLRMLDLFHVPTDAKVVADIGSGPWGGIFFARKWSKMYAVDPAWSFYMEHHLVKLWGLEKCTEQQFSAIESYGQTFKLPEPADLIFSINAINHCGTLEASIRNIMGNLRDGGTFCLHIHLRTPAELEPGHPMSVSEKELKSIVSGWSVKRFEVHDFDPLRLKGRKTAIAEVIR